MGLKDIFKKLNQPISVSKKGAETNQVRLACEFDNSRAIFVQLQKTEYGAQVQRFSKCISSNHGNTPSDELKQFVEGLNVETRKIRLSIKGQGVVVRFIDVPKMKPDELRSALNYEVEKYIPFKANEVVLDYTVLDEDVSIAGGAKGLSILLVAIKRDEVFRIVELFQALNFEVELVEISSLSFINSLEYLQPEEFRGSVGLLEFGANVSSLAIIREGKPRFVRDISYGDQDVVKRLRRTSGLSDEVIFEKLLGKQPVMPEFANHLRDTLKSFVGDLRVSIDYYLDQIPNAQPLSKLYLGGEGGNYSIFSEILSEEINVPVEALQLSQDINIAESVDKADLEQNLGYLPIVLGSAVRDL